MARAAPPPVARALVARVQASRDNSYGNEACGRPAEPGNGLCSNRYALSGREGVGSREKRAGGRRGRR